MKIIKGEFKELSFLHSDPLITTLLVLSTVGAILLVKYF